MGELLKEQDSVVVISDTRKICLSTIRVSQRGRCQPEGYGGGKVPLNCPADLWDPG